MDMKEEQKKDSKKSVLREISQWTITIAGSLAIAMLIKSYAFAITEVRQCSMNDTLFEGQRLIEYKLAYCFSSVPKRGDIVVFDLRKSNNALDTYLTEWKSLLDVFKGTPNEDRLIKRVIGLPGETIDIRDGKVYIDGKEIKEPYVKGITMPRSLELPLKVPKGRVFVMGDNRENSKDSRDLNCIDYSNIEGKTQFRIWPISNAGIVK